MLAKEAYMLYDFAVFDLREDHFDERVRDICDSVIVNQIAYVAILDLVSGYCKDEFFLCSSIKSLTNLVLAHISQVD